MTVTITLDDDLVAALQDRAREDGRDIAAEAASLLADALRDDVDLTEEQRAAIESGVARGDADFAAGRSATAADFYARLQEKHGIRW